MNVQEKLESMLVANGMFQSQAKEVVELSIPSLNELIEDYSISLKRPAYEYPTVIYSILYLVVRPIALKWVDDNVPMAWYRGMFV